MTLEESWKIMEEQGYSESVRCNGNDGAVKEVGFHPTDFMGSPNYEVTVNLSNGDFTFFYMVPKNVAKVTLGPAGPLSNTEHFKKMERKFLEVVEVLEEKFRR